MTHVLLTHGIWPRLTELARSSRRSLVAVAYFGSGASKLLPLTLGSTLVVRCDQVSVGAGLVNPSELLILLQRGVAVFTCQNLHAKVFVFGAKAVVGSSNASANSADSLLEAAVETNDRAVVSACRTYIGSLCGDEVTVQYARALVKLYRPPRFAEVRRRSAVAPGIRLPEHSPLWAVPVNLIKYDDSDEANVKAARASARKRLTDSSAHALDEFVWTGANFIHRLEVGHRVLLCTTVRRGRVMVSPPARVLEIRTYRVGRERRAAIAVERPRRQRTRPIGQLVARLGDTASVLRKLAGPRMLRRKTLVVALGQFWVSGA